MNYLKIFPNCKIVLGHSRALIYDLDRENCELIPLEFAEILLSLDQKTAIVDVLAQYSIEEQKIIQHNLQYIIDNDFGIICSEDLFSCFPKMSLEFSDPSEITNSIIEIKLTTISNLHNYFIQLENLGCFDISLVCYEEISKEYFQNIFLQIPSNRIKSIEIISKWHKEIDDLFLQELSRSCIQVITLTFFAAPNNKVDLKDKKIIFDRQFTTKVITNFSHCGKVDLKYFKSNITKFIESINFNSCLHKKISIDLQGNIGNCPSMPHKYGNIKEISLKEALNNEDFKKYWNLTKDHIETCKDCEFRYVCTDCRAYTERTHETLFGLDTSKPLKCGYDPYTGAWEEWSTNPLKQKAINYYDIKK